jgi:hypothetical protein
MSRTHNMEQTPSEELLGTFISPTFGKFAHPISKTGEGYCMALEEGLLFHSSKAQKSNINLNVYTLACLGVFLV